MAITATPEILPPTRTWRERIGAPGGIFDDRHLELLSHLLDDFLRIPGTPIRFGLDGIVGFFPGIGDILGGLASSIIILAAWLRGVPRVTIARMVLNVGIETAVGAVPFLGNFFDIAWRANRRNYKLLAGSIAQPDRQTVTSWLFIGAVILILIALMLTPVLLLGWFLVHLNAGTTTFPH